MKNVKLKIENYRQVGIVAIISLIIIVALVSIGVFVLFRGQAGQKYEGPVEKVTVRLKWLHQAQFAGMYVADKKGFYEKAGLDVTLKEAEFSKKSAADEVADGDIQFAIVDPIEFLKRVEEGLPIKALAAIYQQSPIAYAARKELNVRSPADFKGHRVAAPEASLQLYATINGVLSLYDLTTDDLTLVTGLGFDNAGNLAEDKVDITGLYRTDDPYQLDKLGVEYDLIFPEKFGFSGYDDVIFTLSRLIEEDPELVRKFVQATIQGWEYAIEHPEEAVDVSLARSTAEEYKDRERQEFIFEQSIPLIKPTGGDSVGAMKFVRWQRIYNTMKESGLIENPFAVQDVYTTEFLK